MAESTHPPPKTSYLSGNFRDFDAFAETAEGWDLDWQQLDRGHLEMTLTQIVGPTVHFGSVSSSRQFLQRGAAPPGYLTAGLLAANSPGVQWCGRAADSCHLLMFRPGAEYDSMSRAGFGAYTLSLHPSLLDEAAKTWEVPWSETGLAESSEVLTCDPSALAALRKKMGSIFSLVGSDPSILARMEVLREFETEVAALLVRLTSPGNKTGRGASSSVRSRALLRAMDLVRQHREEPLTVQALCESLGVSERTLQYAFREHLEVTPKQYLQLVRLQGVRRELRRSDRGTKIVDVANRWGFWHMGQFAADYRRHFLELPSETRRQPLKGKAG